MTRERLFLTAIGAGQIAMGYWVWKHLPGLVQKMAETMARQAGRSGNLFAPVVMLAKPISWVFGIVGVSVGTWLVIMSILGIWSIGPLQ